MTTSFTRFFFTTALAVALLDACARPALAPLPAFEPIAISVERWKQKTDHLVLVLDASSSMLETHQGRAKFDQARSVLAHFNQTMPPLPVKTTLRGFGLDSRVSSKPTKVFFGPAPYDRADLSRALDTLGRAGGPSPMEHALAAVGRELGQGKGPAAVIIVSDGKDIDRAALTAAENLKSLYSDSLCYYTVLVGDDPEGEALLTEIADLTPCGGHTTADTLSTGAAMSGFVQNVLLAQVLDGDGDGVPDNMDHCPKTPTGVRVDKTGCPLDSDGDGVFDDRDACPGTPPGVVVAMDGCPAPKATQSAQVTGAGTWIYKGIQFETGRWDLKPSAYPVLDEIARGLTNQPGIKVEIQGHTDNRGQAAYNRDLSRKRAEAVRKYLVGKGVAADRLTAKGFGFDQPITTNDTIKGRARNRRVELKPLP